jgi:hypothetical protein
VEEAAAGELVDRALDAVAGGEVFLAAGQLANQLVDRDPGRVKVEHAPEQHRFQASVAARVGLVVLVRGHHREAKDPAPRLLPPVSACRSR